VKHIEQMSTLARQPEEVVYPLSGDEPVEGLLVYENAYRCLATNTDGMTYPKILCTIGSMQRHCSQQHGWVNEQQRGGHLQLRKKQTANRLWQDSQRCQNFFHVGQWKRYFQVQSRLTKCTAIDRQNVS
jgi:hypothetical protein